MINPKRLSLLSSWIIDLGLVTPLCGLWFSCGCDWPWNGLFMACNAITKTTPPPHCPWCVYPLTAILSIAIGLAAGTRVALKAYPCPLNRVAATLYRSAVSAAAFVGGTVSGRLVERARYRLSYLSWRELELNDVQPFRAL